MKPQGCVFLERRRFSVNRCKGGICCALALAMLCLSLPCPAEEAPLPAETAAPILTEASP